MTKEILIEELVKVLKKAHNEQRYITSDKSIRAIAETVVDAFYAIERPKGEWLRRKGNPEAVCSNCGRDAVYQIIDDRWQFENFCPHCGVKMKE